jgi:hypothetical protein
LAHVDRSLAIAQVFQPQPAFTAGTYAAGIAVKSAATLVLAADAAAIGVDAPSTPIAVIAASGTYVDGTYIGMTLAASGVDVAGMSSTAGVGSEATLAPRSTEDEAVIPVVQPARTNTENKPITRMAQNLRENMTTFL